MEFEVTHHNSKYELENSYGLNRMECSLMSPSLRDPAQFGKGKLN
jgi:hypothetical protein